MSGLRALELRVPPVAFLLLTAGLMWIGSRSVPSLAFHIPGRGLLAAALAVAGLTVSALGVRAFRRARTTVDPTRPAAASRLVDSGLYGISRNPMYLGFALVLVGWAVFLSHLLASALVAGFVLYMNRFQIAPEERALAAAFGSDYVSYKRRVRRWI